MGDFPVLSQWINADGDLLYPSPLVETRDTTPAEIVVHATSDGYLAVTRDWDADEHLHVFSSDADGRLIGPAFRCRTPADWDDC